LSADCANPSAAAHVIDLEQASRFFLWPQNDQALFNFSTGGKIGIFDIYVGFVEALRDFGQEYQAGSLSRWLADGV
jgi:hypothetical protein